MNRINIMSACAAVALGLVGCGDTDDTHPHDTAVAPAIAESSDSSPDGDHGADDRGDSDHGNDDHGDHSDEPIRQAEAHFHGNAALAFALDGAALSVELDTPLYNLTGFEYAPQTPEEVSTVQSVQALLAQPGGLFSFNAEAGCTAREQSQTVQLLTEADDHDHDHDESDHAADTHRDTVIEYLFDCSSPDRLNEITVRLFEHFPRFEELDAVYLDQNTQQSIRLSPVNDRINLAR